MKSIPIKNKKTNARINSLKFFYSQEFGSNIPPDEFLKIFDLSSSGKLYFFKIVSINPKEKINLINIIEKNLKNWSIERISLIDKNIILIALIENSFKLKKQIIINEAIEISKMFGTKDSPSFINGILDKIIK